MPSMYTKEFAEIQHGKRECWFCKSKKADSTCNSCGKYSNCQNCPKCKKITENSCSACGCGSCYECGYIYSCNPMCYSWVDLPIGPYSGPVLTDVRFAPGQKCPHNFYYYDKERGYLCSDCNKTLSIKEVKAAIQEEIKNESKFIIRQSRWYTKWVYQS